jgi:hypothetical protein
MSNQILKDAKGKVMGKIWTSGHGVQELKDSKGKKLGYYDPRTDVTKTRNGRKVGKGNLLLTLLN